MIGRPVLLINLLVERYNLVPVVFYNYLRYLVPGGPLVHQILLL